MDASLLQVLERCYQTDRCYHMHLSPKTQCAITTGAHECLRVWPLAFRTLRVVREFMPALCPTPLRVVRGFMPALCPTPGVRRRSTFMNIHEYTTTMIDRCEHGWLESLCRSMPCQVSAWETKGRRKSLSKERPIGLNYDDWMPNWLILKNLNSCLGSVDWLW